MLVVPGAPSFDTVRNVSSSVLRVVWNPPVNENGKFLGYLLCWTLLSSGTPDCNKTAYDQRNFNIRGLSKLSNVMHLLILEKFLFNLSFDFSFILFKFSDVSF